MAQHVPEGLESLRRLPLAEVIPVLCPGAYLSHERQGPGRVRWVLPDGTKVNVLPLTDGDVFRVMNRPDERLTVSPKGAINFVMVVRHTSLLQAVQMLHQMRPAWGLARRESRPVRVRSTILRHPARMADPEREWFQVRDYLVGERRLPELLVADLYRRGYVYAGAGFYQGYVVFPHRADGPDSSVTGYSLRWAQASPPPSNRPTKWVASGSRLKDGWVTLGQSRQTLVITESPIDAITLWASAIDEGVAHRVSIRSSSGAGGLAERMWKGFDAVVTAFDHDAAGQGYAEWVRQHRSKDPITTISPPGSYKDWNEAWRAGHRALLETTQLWEREMVRMHEDRGRAR